MKSAGDCQDNEEVQVKRREVWSVQMNVKIVKKYTGKWKALWSILIGLIFSTRK